MKKSHFREKYHITDTKPVDVIKHRISVVDFVRATETFINENFYGICEISHDVSYNTRMITVAEGHVACFFRELLESVYGKEMIRIKMSLDDELFSVNIEADGHLPIDFKDANRLIRLARSAEFSVTINNTCLRIYMEHSKALIALRAISFHTLYGTFYQMFFGPRTEETSTT